ncbi:MAG TPA: hypothetical protein VIY66_12825 [Candidatus Acidoferrales bacterium]
MLDDTTGEVVERRLDHLNKEAEAFYRSLHQPVRVGIEATGVSRALVLCEAPGHKEGSRLDG